MQCDECAATGWQFDWAPVLSQVAPLIVEEAFYDTNTQEFTFVKVWLLLQCLPVRTQA